MSGGGVESSTTLERSGIGDSYTEIWHRRLQVAAVVELLRKLKSKSTWSSSCLVSISRKDLQTDGFGSIFGGPPDPTIGPLSPPEIKEIRLLVFRAIGKCSTLETVDLSEDEEFPINLTDEELQALLEPLQYSTSVVKLNLDGQGVLSTPSGARAVWMFLGINRSCQVLSTSTPKDPTPGYIIDTIDDRNLLIKVQKSLPAGDGLRPLIYWHGLGPQISAPRAIRILHAFPNLRAMYWQPETLTQWQCCEDIDTDYSYRKVTETLHGASLDSVSLIGRPEGLDAVMDVFAKGRKQLRVFRIYCTHSHQGYKRRNSQAEDFYEFEEGYRGYPESCPWDRMDGLFPQQVRLEHTSDNLETNVEAVLSRSSELEYVGLYRLSFTGMKWGLIFRSLSGAPRLLKFGCSCDLKLGFDEVCWKDLTSLVQISSKLKILNLESYPSPGSRSRSGACDFLEAMKSNQVVEMLVLNHFHMEFGEVRALAHLIEENSCLKELSLAACRFSERDIDVVGLFRSLGRNVVLWRLDLSGVQGLTDKAFSDLMVALQGPSLIQEIEIKNTIWVQKGKEPMLQRALEEKLHRQNYTGIMRGLLRGDKFMLPNSGRLFLCGEPYSGKTELRKSLVKLAAKPDSSRLKVSRHLGLPVYRDSTTRRLLRRHSKPDERTNGVEIELCLIDGMQISIWDLAGQEIFRALHDCLFPTFNTACVFLFVFSPYDRSTKHLKVPLASALRVEFLPWLRFIATNSEAGKGQSPVKILVSHMDKLETADLDLGWAEEVATEMHHRFKELLAVDFRVLGANSTVLLRGVNTVLDRTREAFTDLLKTEHLSRRTVPRTCCEIMDALRSRKTAGNAQETPVVRSEEFFSFCEENAPSLQEYKNGPKTRDHELLMNAIAEYLHDAGIIIRLPISGLVVLDPNWCTCSFLGRLIGLGQGYLSPRVRTDGLTGRNGDLITKADFQKLLLTLVEGFTWKQVYPARDVVQQLQAMMEEMDLCFEVRVEDAMEEDKKTRIFAPILFAESGENARKFCRLPEWSLCGSLGTEPSYVGLRVQCRDSERTRLTSSFFPRLQVFFRNSLISKHSRFEDLLICDYNLMTLTTDGHEIHIENDRMVNGDHVDILAHSYSSHNDAMHYILQNVVEMIQKFCASPKGCPGIALTVSVLRSDCVRKLTSSLHRGEKVAVRVETLVSDWKAEAIRKVLSEDHSASTDTGADYIHTWPAVDTVGLPMLAERARDLLMDTHLSEVVRSVGDAVGERQRRVTSVEEEVAQLFSRSNTNPATNGGMSLPHLESVCEEGGSASDLKNSGFEQIAQAVNMIDEKVDEVKGLVVEVLSEVKMIRAFQGSFQSSLLSLTHALDRLSGYSSSNLDIPKRPYFTSKSVGVRHYITARIRVGTALTLHFMCERKSGFHYVEGQEGYPLVVKKDNMDVVRFLSVNSIKLLAFLVKAGMHVGAGFSPSLADLELPGPGEYMTLTEATANELLRKLEPSERLLGESGEGTINTKIDVVEESWTYLKQLFLSHLKDHCQELFQLYRCRYSLPSTSREGESSYAWLCKDCFLKGFRNGSVVECR